MSRKFVYYGAGRSADELLLDLYPATAGYSLRKLRTAYTGSAIRVRRSSDNAEQDIGFVGNDLDTASLLSFVGVGNGFVTTWYDQQGSNDLTQGTSSAQPQIVSSGVTIVRGGLPAVKFDGSNDEINNFSTSFLNTFSVSYFSVANGDSLESVGVVHNQSSLQNTGLRTFLDTRSNIKRNLAVSVGNTLYTADMSTFRVSTSPRLLSSFIDGSQNMSSYDNADVGLTDTYLGNVNNDGLRLGSQSVTFLNGTIQEFIAYNTDELSNRISIETNINDYYGIY